MSKTSELTFPALLFSLHAGIVTLKFIPRGPRRYFVNYETSWPGAYIAPHPNRRAQLEQRVHLRSAWVVAKVSNDGPENKNNGTALFTVMASYGPQEDVDCTRSLSERTGLPLPAAPAGGRLFH